MEVLHSSCIIFSKYSANFDFENNQIRIILTQKRLIRRLIWLLEPFYDSSSWFFSTGIVPYAILEGFLSSEN